MSHESPVKIKICGLCTPELAKAAVDAGADMVGLVFVERSPRFVTLEEAQAVARDMAGSAEVVGLFKDQPLADVKRLVDDVPLSVVQLHGDYTPGMLADPAGPRFMRSIAFDPATIEDNLQTWDAHHAINPRMIALMIDAPDPSKIGGGTGNTFDWHALRDVLDRVKPMAPIVLAGGLNPDNVADAIRIIQPWMVDVSSGVEASRGTKDAGLIRAFCAAAAASSQ
jgi:phosphoribosylanthranilate isomerase